jgi:hypothetical protein
MDITVSLTAVQYKAFQYVAYSPEEWIQNAATSRASAAIDEVAKNEVERMMKDPTVTSIPADKDTIVMNCTQPTAKQIQDEQTAKQIQDAQAQAP